MSKFIRAEIELQKEDLEEYAKDRIGDYNDYFILDYVQGLLDESAIAVHVNNCVICDDEE